MMIFRKIIFHFLCWNMWCLLAAQAANAENPKFAIASLSVINLRLTPSYAGEMGTQVLMGTPLLVLESAHGWLKVKTPEGYSSWTTEESVKLLSEEELKVWNKQLKVIVTDYFTLLRDDVSEKSSVVSDVVWGNIMRNLGEKDDCYKVGLPDGRIGYLKKKSAMPLDQWLDSRHPTAENIVATAKEFIGFPYFWGGTSVKGMDCSGFTKTCFFLNGVVLLRDADEQARTGDFIDISTGYEKLQPGDLIFFGSKKEGKENITHVGIYIGNGEFIHSSGMVHVSSLSSSSPLYDAWNAKRLLKASRIIPQIDKDPNIISLKLHPYYQ
jgi:SH3-like domain-containing protein